MSTAAAAGADSRSTGDASDARGERAAANHAERIRFLIMVMAGFCSVKFEAQAQAAGKARSVGTVLYYHRDRNVIKHPT